MAPDAQAERARAFHSHPVETPYSLDAGPGRYRIGLMVLASDYVTERDYQSVLSGQPRDAVVVYTSRVLNVNPVTVENLRSMAPRLTEAASLIVPAGRIDAMAYSCTSGTVAIGFEAIETAIQAGRPGVPCATPITAALEGFGRLGLGRIAVLTPYTDDVNQAINDHLIGQGLDVVAFTAFGIADDNDMAGLSPEVLIQAAREADRPEAEALFISCTAIRAVDAVQRIEDALGKPVITANQALIWQSLRFAGFSEAIPGYGTLMTL